MPAGIFVTLYTLLLHIFISLYVYIRTVFWDTRIAASSFRPTDTRLPDVPDQSRFIESWFDWYRGFKIITKEDGTVQQHPLHRESLGEVPPGHLPQTMDNLDTSGDRNRSQHHTNTSSEFDMSPQANSSISEPPDSAPSSRPSSSMEEHISPPTVAQRYVASQFERRRAAGSNIDPSSYTWLSSHQPDHPATPQYHNPTQASVFGSREEVERQGSNYVSPITDLFTNAYRSMPQSTVRPYEPPTFNAHVRSHRQHTEETPTQRQARNTSARLAAATRRSAHERVNSNRRPSESGNPSTNDPSRQESPRHNVLMASTRAASMQRSTLDTNTNTNSATSPPPGERSTHQRMLQYDEQGSLLLPHLHPPSDGTPSQYNPQGTLHGDFMFPPDDFPLYYNPSRLHETPDQPAYARENPFDPFDSQGEGEDGIPPHHVRAHRNFRVEDYLALENQRATHGHSVHGGPSREWMLGALHQRASEARQNQRQVGLDVDKTRPAPLKKEEMVVERECKVCMEQLASIVCLPCGMLFLTKSLKSTILANREQGTV